MARRLRSDLPDGLFHVTARGVDGTAIFLDDRDRRFFLQLLASCVARFSWRCDAFCLMGNHYHLIVDAKVRRLSAGLQRLNGIYAQTFNDRHARRGHLFGDRFWSGSIESEEHLRAACAYVVLNPVRAGICGRAEDWGWTASRYGFETA